MPKLSQGRHVVPRHPHLRDSVFFYTQKDTDVKVDPSSGGWERPHGTPLRLFIFEPQGRPVTFRMRR